MISKPSRYSSMGMRCVITGVTRHAAFAVGRGAELGTLEVGKLAECALWDVDHPRELTYWLGRNPCAGVIRDGRPAPAG